MPLPVPPDSPLKNVPKLSDAMSEGQKSLDELADSLPKTPKLADAANSFLDLFNRLFTNLGLPRLPSLPTPPVPPAPPAGLPELPPLPGTGTAGLFDISKITGSEK